MPKIIENVRGKLLDEARRQIEENGYKETTVRSVAAALSIGLGTLYNYFESKDMLVASFMLEDWSESMAEMRESIDCCADSYEKLRLIYEGLRAFSEKHKKLLAKVDEYGGYAMIESAMTYVKTENFENLNFDEILNDLYVLRHNHLNHTDPWLVFVFYCTVPWHS